VACCGGHNRYHLSDEEVEALTGTNQRLGPRWRGFPPLVEGNPVVSEEEAAEIGTDLGGDGTGDGRHRR
jgi:hypothetical protein